MGGNPIYLSDNQLTLQKLKCDLLVHITKLRLAVQLLLQKIFKAEEKSVQLILNDFLAKGSTWMQLEEIRISIM